MSESDYDSVDEHTSLMDGHVAEARNDGHGLMDHRKRRYKVASSIEVNKCKVEKSYKITKHFLYKHFHIIEMIFSWTMGQCLKYELNPEQEGLVTEEEDQANEVTMQSNNNKTKKKRNWNTELLMWLNYLLRFLFVCL